MDIKFEEQLQVDRKKIHNAILLQLPIEITTYTLPRNMEVYIRSLLQIFLEECHQEYMYEYLNFSAGELLTNAKKANTKRVYFKEKNLDINDLQDYEVGMRTFKDDTLSNIDYYLDLQKKAGLYIKLILHLIGDKIKIEIRNNCLLTQPEKDRIADKLNNVGQYNDIQEVLNTILDQSEGAGLGIIIIILMLEKIGLSKENYKVFCTDTETVTQIILPCNEQIYSALEGISYEYVNLQNSFPVLQSSYEELINTLKEPVVDIQKAANILKKDPSLTFFLLQEASKKDTSNIDMQSILQSFTTEELLNLFTKQPQTFNFIEPSQENLYLWEHSQKAAFYSYNFAKNCQHELSIFSPDELYILSLINSMGLIILKNPTQEQTDFVRDLSNQYELTEKINKVFYDGTICQYMNMLLYKKFKLPKKVNDMILTWTDTKNLLEKYKTYLDIIILGGLMAYYLEHKVDYYQINQEVLKSFNIQNENQFEYLANELSKSFEA